MLGVDDFGGGDANGGFDVAALAHPFVVVDLAEIAHAGVWKKSDDESFGAKVFGKAESCGDASAAGAAGEDTFEFDQTAREDEALFIVDLKDVVENLEIHGSREKILADAFDDVGLGLDGFAALEEIVVEGADGIDSDNFDAGILLLEIFADTADGAAGAYAADKMRDFALTVFPDFRAGREVVSLGVHGIVILIGIEGVGNFAREFFSDGVVAARVFGLDGGGANDDFGAKRFQQIHFFL